MTIDDMIRLAHEAGWEYADGDDGYAPLWEFGQLVAAAEREECAKAAEAVVPRHTECGNKIAGAIRARSNHD